jgi:uncharacterized protein (TIGR02145 family)
LRQTRQATAPDTQAAGEIDSAIGTFTDERDGERYKIVEIGGMTWMAKNLNYRTDSSWCYNDDSSNCGQYGRLYSRRAAKNACPSGWHLPSRQEWDYLSQAVGGEDVAGKVLKSASGIGWYCGGGIDSHKFSAMPGGYRNYDGSFGGLSGNANWWTTTEDDSGRGYHQSLEYTDDGAFGGYGGYDDGFSVRCVQDGSAERVQKMMEGEKRRIERLSVYFTDSRDGRSYRAVKIGGNLWMAEDLKYQPASGGSWCYKNDNYNCDKYGRLYDWNTAAEACPAGWHLPSRQEWDDLGLTVGAERQPGSVKNEVGNIDIVNWYGAGKKLKAKTGWNSNGNGSDDYGFSALPGGYRYYKNGLFDYDGYRSHYWTATENGGDRAYDRDVYHDEDYLYEYDGDKAYGLSVRCVQNSP